MATCSVCNLIYEDIVLVIRVLLLPHLYFYHVLVLYKHYSHLLSLMVLTVGPALHGFSSKAKVLNFYLLALVAKGWSHRERRGGENT